MVVEIEMTEVVTYRVEMTNQEFAALTTENPAEATAESLRALVESEPDTDYGVKNAYGLLDKMIDAGFDEANNRTWSISISDDEKEN